MARTPARLRDHRRCVSSDRSLGGARRRATLVVQARRRRRSCPPPCTLEVDESAAEPRRAGQDGRLAALRLRPRSAPATCRPSGSSRPFDASEWSFQAGKLLEFSPIVAKGTLYFQDKDALFYALSADKGKVEWKKDIGAPRRRLARLLARRPLRGHPAARPGSTRAGAGAARQGRQAAVALPAAGPQRDLADRRRHERDRRQRVGRRLRARPQERASRLAGDTAGAVKGGLALDDGRPLRRQLRRRGVRARRLERRRQVWQIEHPGARASAAAGRSTRRRRSPSAASTSAASTAASTASTRTPASCLEPLDRRLGLRRARPSPTRRSTEPTVYVGSKDQNFYALDAEDRRGALAGAHRRRHPRRRQRARRDRLRRRPRAEHRHLRLQRRRRAAGLRVTSSASTTR